jgi:putative hemolysin
MSNILAKNLSYKTVFFLLILIFSSSHGEEPQGSIFKFGNKNIEFIVQNKLVISKNCSQISPPAKCMATKSIMNVSFLAINRMEGGVNPGARICKMQAGGHVLLGVDSKGNEMTFCRFADDSLISNDSLIYASLQNDKNK